MQDLGLGSGNVYLIFKEEKEAKFYQAPKKQNPLPLKPKINRDLDEVKDDGLLNLTGSPLKCSFNLDEGDENADDFPTDSPVIISKSGFVPLSAGEARRIVSAFNGKVNGKSSGCEEEDFHLWALCDGQCNGLLALGSQRSARSLTLTTIKVDKAKETSDLPKLEDIIKMHGNNNNTKDKLHISASAVYQLHQNLKAELSWNRPRFVMENPASDAQTELSICVSSGSCDELLTLKGFSSGLTDGRITWMPAEDEEDFDDDEAELVRVLGLIKQLGPRGIGHKQRESPKNDNDDDDESEKEDFSSSRKDLDFTDLLWPVLRRVQSMSQLSLRFNQILRVIRDDHLRPFMFPNNRTMLAEVVRGIIRGESESESGEVVNDKLALEMLVEIGAEKLRRDFVHSLVSNSLASKEELKPLLRNAAGQLESLQVIVESVRMLKAFLSPSQEALRWIVLQALKNPPSLSQRVKYHIHTVHVRERLIKSEPNLWSLKLRSDELETVANFSVEPPGDDIHREMIPTTNPSDIGSPIINEGNENSNNKMYYFSAIRESITRQV